MTTPRTVTVPGARLACYVTGDLTTCTSRAPALLLVGSPMDSTGFAPLASSVPDRVVVTLDPRNTGHSERDDPTAAVTPEQHAGDLAAVLVDLDTPPVDVLASSGGAVNALELVAEHPGLVRTLVAHEPPAAGVLPDRAEVAEACRRMVTAYDAHGTGPAMAAFIRLLMHSGPVTAGYLAAPAPDPAAFGLPTEDDGLREDPLMANLRGGGAGYVPRADALRSATTRVVVGVGADSGGPEDGELAGRAAYAVAALLGQEVVVFPGGHAGFLGGDPGKIGDPEAFSARLRGVLG